MDHRQS